MKHRVWVLGGLLLGLAGCVQPQTRLQAPDDAERDKDAEVQTVGDISSFANADPTPVSGVGLVVGLEGTGGAATPGSYRDLLERELQKDGVEHIKEILASPVNSLVLVSAVIPPGAHKGDPLDVRVTLPPQSKTTSLRGGYLKRCYLYNYDSTKHVDPHFAGSNQLLMGHVLAHAEGPIMVGPAGSKDGAVEGQLWGGGHSRVSRPLYVVLNKDQQSGPVVQRVAQRINETFHGSPGGAGNGLATAKTKTFLVLQVPLQYRYNLGRFMRVVRLIPVAETPAADSPYHRRLEADLLDPARTVTAALRLEALGAGSIAVLKQGLQSEHALVRFSAAEALAYLGDSACGEELAHLVDHEPTMRSYGLAALASLDEAVSHVKLRELLLARDAETRYGAFWALRSLDEHDPAAQGELLNDSFWLHRTAPGSAPLVHYSTSRRAEVVLFGEGIALVPPFSFLAGEFTITAARDDTHCTVSRLSVRQGSRRRQCSLNLEEVLRLLAELGGSYPEVIDFLRQAREYHCVNCPIAADALPQATSVYELAKSGSTKEVSGQ
jgi:hypothetical protein